MVSEDQKRSPRNQKYPATEGNGQSQNLNDAVFSPRFKSAAAMAGWDEEALLLASLVVEDTPDRDFKHKKRSVLNSKTPPTNSRRKRRAQSSPESIRVAVLDLDEEDTPRKDSEEKTKEKKATVNEESKEGGKESTKEKSGVAALPCIDKLRDELSCAICLEICFEPSTTPCGHSFCKKCLRSAADKCGKKCPKCRQLIGNGRSCTVNTVLWNTIQLLFPQEVEARKAAGAINSRQQSKCLSPEAAFYNNLRNDESTTTRGGVSTRRSGGRAAAITDQEARRLQGVRSRRGVTPATQTEDAAIALRLQREEFMHAFRGTQEQHHSSRSSSVDLARENLRAMASRAMTLRIRDRRF